MEKPIKESKARVSDDPNQNLKAAVSYLLFFVTGVIMLLVEGRNPYIRFHAIQSILTFVVWLMLALLISLVPILNIFLGLIWWLVGLFVWINLMYKANSGELYKLPWVGEIAQKQAEKLTF